MMRALKSPSREIEKTATTISILVMIGVWIAGFAIYMAGLYAGVIHCNHRCYWCGKHLESKAESRYSR